MIYDTDAITGIPRMVEVKPHVLPSTMQDKGRGVINLVCRRFRVEMADIGARTRHPRVVVARAVMVHLLRRHTTLSYPEIARAMGRPNHSTVITAHNRLRKQYDEDKPVTAAGMDAITTRALVDTLDRIIVEKQSW